METCLYKVVYEPQRPWYHCSWSMPFDNKRATTIVEAPKGIFYWDLSYLLDEKLPGFFKLVSFHETEILKLV